MEYALGTKSILEMTFGGTSVYIRPLFYGLLIMGLTLTFMLIYKDDFSNVTFMISVLNAFANALGVFMKNSLAESFTNGKYNYVVQSVDGICLLISGITMIYLLRKLRKDLKAHNVKR